MEARWNEVSTTSGSSRAPKSGTTGYTPRSRPRSQARLRDAGLRDVSGFRRGTDVWWYAECEPDRKAAFRAYATGRANRQWGRSSAMSSRRWKPPAAGSSGTTRSSTPTRQRLKDRASAAASASVIDPRAATLYDNLHANPWPEMLEAIAEAGYRDYTGFRRGAHVVYMGRYYPDFDTVIERINATDVAARWGRRWATSSPPSPVPRGATSPPPRSTTRTEAATGRCETTDGQPLG